MVCGALFQFYAGFSQPAFFPAPLTGMFNLLLTTLQPMMAIMTEHRGVFEDFTAVSPEEYSDTRGSHFSTKLFWSWMGTALLHGTLTFSLCMAGFPTSQDGEGVRSIGLQEQATLVFTVLLHVVFLKLYLSLQRAPEVSVVLLILTLALYYGFIAFLSTDTWWITHATDGELLHVAHHALFQPRPLLLVPTIAVLVVFPDYSYNSFSFLWLFFRDKKYEKKAIEEVKATLREERRTSSRLVENRRHGTRQLLEDDDGPAQLIRSDTKK